MSLLPDMLREVVLVYDDMRIRGFVTDMTIDAPPPNLLEVDVGTGRRFVDAGVRDTPTLHLTMKMLPQPLDSVNVASDEEAKPQEVSIEEAMKRLSIVGEKFKYLDYGSD